MFKKIEKKLINYFYVNTVQILILMTAVFLVFNLFTEIPYLNLLLGNVFIKISLVWLIAVIIFKVGYKQQILALMTVLLIMPVFVFLGSQSYENLGLIMFMFIIAAITTYIVMTD